jgi:hypothetical protein
MQTLLFDIPETQTLPQVQEKTFYKCKQCISFFEHEYTRKLTYCKVRTQKGTAYGCKKVKLNDNICQKFKLK